jgi:hypothetical protein
MSTNSELVLVREKIPYSGKGIDPLLTLLRQVLNDNPYTQEFTCRIGHPIEIAKLVPPDQAPERQSLHDVIRGNRMEEYTIEKDKSPFQVLWDMFGLVHDEGLEVGFLVVGDKFLFQKWLGIRIAQNRMNFYGTPVMPLSDIPLDVFLVVGAEKKQAEVEDIKFSVKGTLP